MVSRVKNLSVICGDAQQIIPSVFPSHFLSEIFINHPQPPLLKDRGTIDFEGQGQHLFTYAFMRELHRILVIGGSVTIVTDNKQYAYLLLSELHGKHSDLFYSKSILDENSDDSLFLENSVGGTVSINSSNQSESGFILLRGEPDSRVGHVVCASSYFNRLWERGKLTRRWILYFSSK